MDSLITVIVPVYNVGKYVDRCLSSIISQTYANLEILVVVDLECHVDQSASICLEHEKNDARVKIIHQKNRGLSGARNDALDLSAGEYIMFVDGDDFIDSHMVENLYFTARQQGADISIGGYDDFFGGTVSDYIPGNIRMILKQEAFEMLVDKKYSTGMRTAWGKLYKKALFEGLRFREHSYCEDMLIIHRLLHKADAIAYDTTPYYHYVQENMDSLDRSEFNLGKTVYLEATGYWRDLIRKEYPAVYEKAESFHAVSISDILYAMRNIGAEEKLRVQKHYTDELKKKKTVWLHSGELNAKDKIKIFAAMAQWWWLYDLYHKFRRM